MNHEPATTSIRIRLWDLPLRIFHWALVLAVLTAFITARLGGEWMGLHGKAGLAIIGLLAFRITWGVIGSTHARFKTFAPSPAAIRAYLKGRWQGIGHTPLGALAVFALLGLLAAQAGTGLFSNDDIAFNGPLSGLIDKELSDRLTGLHHQLSNILLLLMGLHIAAIVFYVWLKKNNLVKPMLTGWKEIKSSDTANHTGKNSVARKGSAIALVAALLIAVIAVYGASGAILRASPAVSASRSSSW